LWSGAAIAAAIAVGGFGCGNARHDFRIDRLNPAIRHVDQKRAELASLLRLTHAHRPRDAQVLRAQVARLGAAIRRVTTLRPPAGTESRFRRYVRANAALLGSLSRFVDAFASGTRAEQQQARQVAELAVGEVDTAKTALQHQLK
jgi:hypothetical protein